MSAMDVEIPVPTPVHAPTTNTTSATVEVAAALPTLAAGDASGTDPALQGDTSAPHLGFTPTIEQAAPAVSTATTPAATDSDAAQGDGSHEDTDETKSDTDDHEDDEDESGSDEEDEDDEEDESEGGSDNEEDDDQRSTMSIDDPPSIAPPPPAPVIPFPRPLPSDLIKPICVHLCKKDIKTLLSVQASCQAGWDAATPLLYRSVALNSERAWRSFFAPWEVKVKVKDKEVVGGGGGEKTDEKKGEEGDAAAVGIVKVDAGKESETAPADGGEVQGAVVADNAALATDVVIAAGTTTNTAQTTTGAVMTANSHATVVEGSTTSSAINGSSTHIPSQISTSPASRTGIANPAPDTHLGSGLSTGPPDLVCRFEDIRGDAETSTQSSSNSVSEKDDDEYAPLSASQLRARKAMGAARKLKVGFLPSRQTRDWMRGAIGQLSNEYGPDVDFPALLLPNVKSVMFGPKIFIGVHDGAFGDNMESPFADLCQPTSFCIDFGDQHFGEDSGNYSTFGVVNRSYLDEDILFCVQYWKKLTHVNIHSTAACYPISTHFPGIHTNMYVTPPNHRPTIKGDDGYAIAMQLVKLIVGYISDDATEDEKAETKWELAFIDKFVHPDVLGTDHHDVPFMAYMRGDLAWDASDKLEDKIKVARASGSISADKADRWRDRLDRFFEGETLKFWEERGMDKCVACGRNDE